MHRREGTQPLPSGGCGHRDSRGRGAAGTTGQGWQLTVRGAASFGRGVHLVGGWGTARLQAPVPLFFFFLIVNSATTWKRREEGTGRGEYQQVSAPE